MKKYSVFLESSLRGADENGELRENPAAFRNINAAIMLVIEAAMTAAMPEPLVHVVGGMDNITFQPDRTFLVARRAQRVRCHLHSGCGGHLCLGAHIYFVNSEGESVLCIEAAADSDGIRYIRRAQQMATLSLPASE